MRHFLFLAFCLVALTACEDETLASLDSTELNLLAPDGPDLFALESITGTSSRPNNMVASFINLTSVIDQLDSFQQDRIVGAITNTGAIIEFDRLRFILVYPNTGEQVCFNVSFLLEDIGKSRATTICFTP